MDELIILEDDCIPTNAFFEFCTEMLKRYKNEERISVISGRSQLNLPKVFLENDYIFTQYAPTWGWATWKRVWDNFDIQLRNVKAIVESNKFKGVFSSREQEKFFTRRFYRDIKDPYIHTHIWDNQFGYHSRINGALRITPSKNLIKYIGLEGTHSNSSTDFFADISVDDSFIVKKHPHKISIIKEYDELYFKKFVFSPLSLSERIISKIIKSIHRLFLAAPREPRV